MSGLIGFKVTGCFNHTFIVHFEQTVSDRQEQRRKFLKNMKRTMR